MSIFDLVFEGRISHSMACTAHRTEEFHSLENHILTSESGLGRTDVARKIEGSHYHLFARKLRTFFL